ncbi:hypothetical protein FOL47_004203, partial [Perkinsus chesapeaki]
MSVVDAVDAVDDAVLQAASTLPSTPSTDGFIKAYTSVMKADAELSTAMSDRQALYRNTVETGTGRGATWAGMRGQAPRNPILRLHVWNTTDGKLYPEDAAERNPAVWERVDGDRYDGVQFSQEGRKELVLKLVFFMRDVPGSMIEVPADIERLVTGRRRITMPTLIRSLWGYIRRGNLIIENGSGDVRFQPDGLLTAHLFPEDLMTTGPPPARTVEELYDAAVRMCKHPGPVVINHRLNFDQIDPSASEMVYSIPVDLAYCDTPLQNTTCSEPTARRLTSFPDPKSDTLNTLKSSCNNLVVAADRLDFIKAFASDPRGVLEAALEDEEGSPSATSEKSIEEAEEVEEAPVRKRRRTSSMLSEVSALEEPEQVADSDQVCSVTSLGSTAAAFNTDADDTAFESPRSHIDRPSFLGDVGDIADSRPQLEPVEEESEGEEEEEHGSRSSAASPSVVSVGSDTSQLSTPIRSSESEGTHTEGSVGIGEAVEALDEHFEEASTRSTDEEESIEEVVEPTSEEDEEEEALRRDEGDWEELESTEEAIVPSSDEGENLPFEDEEMEDVEMEDVELGSHDSDSEALEVESKASDGSGEDATPHEEEHTPESAVESPRSQIKSDEEVDGTKTPTADSLLEYHLVEESDAIGSPSESVQFSPDEDGEQPESPLGSRPIDPRESLSVDLDDLHEESDGERGSHVDKQERELAEEEEPITSATPAERATQRDDAQSEHEAEESREVQDTAVADGGETEDIPKSAAGRPLRRAAIAALDMIHSEISAFTRPYHYHTHDVPSHTEGSKEQSPKAESSPARTSPRRRSPKKERPTEAASSVESPEKMIDAGTSLGRYPSPLGTAVGKRRSPPKDSQRSYVPSEGSSDTSSVVEDLPSTPTSSLEPIPMTPAPKRANKRGGRLTQLSRSPTIRRTTRASALEAKNRIHELAGGRGTTAHNADESQEEHLASGSALLNAIEEDRVRGMYEKSISPQGTASMKSRDLHVPPSIDPPVFHQVDNEANESENVGMRHPVEEMQKKSLINSETRTLESASVMFGMNMPSRMLMERNLLSTFQRLPGAGPSSLLGLETVMGLNDTIEAADYMNPKLKFGEKSRVVRLDGHITVGEILSKYGSKSGLNVCKDKDGVELDHDLTLTQIRALAECKDASDVVPLDLAAEEE